MVRPVIADPYRDAELARCTTWTTPVARTMPTTGLAAQPGARTIIDLGCGTALLTRPLATPGRTVIGFDPSRTMLDHARRSPHPLSITDTPRLPSPPRRP